MVVAAPCFEVSAAVGDASVEAVEAAAAVAYTGETVAVEFSTNT